MERNGPIDRAVTWVTAGIITAILIGLGYWALAGLMRVPVLP